MMSKNKEEPLFVPGEYVQVIHSDEWANGQTVKIEKVYIGTGSVDLIGQYTGYVYEFIYGSSIVKWPEPLLKKISGNVPLERWEECPFIPENVDS